MNSELHKIIKEINKLLNSKDFKNIISIASSIYWIVGQFNAPKCPACNQTLFFIGIDYCCTNCTKLPLNH